MKANIYLDQGVDFSTAIDLKTQSGEDYALPPGQVIVKAAKVYSEGIAFQGVATLVNNNPEINLTLSFPGSITQDIDPGRYQYDVIHIDSSTSKNTKLMEGYITVKPSISLRSN